jgi:predicted dehydrogenase
VERGQIHAQAYRVASGGTKSAKQESPSGENAAKWKWGDAHEAQWHDFVKCCTDGGTPRVAGTDGRNSIALIEAIHHSAESGQAVVIP